MTEAIKYISNSKKGLAREKNQDRILIVEHTDYYLFCLFDGVSSLPLSYLFAEKFKKRIETKINTIDSNGNNLDKLLYNINKEIVGLGIQGLSTISVVFYNKMDDIVRYLNIGDTRIYAFTNQFLEKITIDDSVTGRENVITRFLGAESLTLKDFELKSIEKKYNFLLCTDGFYKLMEENLRDYFNAIHFKNFANVKRKIDYLQRRKNRDDSSYILIRNEISNRS
jgi:serine/threonine protein phosphatase PrpC